MDKKIEKAVSVLEAVLKNYRNPCLLCSFGKDSMVLLFMLRHWFEEVPVVFLRQPFFQRKYAYANRVIEDWNIKEFYQDIPPIGVTVSHNQGKTELVNHYNFGATTLMVPIGRIEPTPGANYLCGKEDLMDRPIGSFNWPWDCAIHGHKATDTDPLHDDLNINIDISYNIGGSDCAFPLREWTDEDIWQFTEKHDIPINHSRYEKVDGTWRNKADMSYNSDYFPYCNRCFDPLQPDAVDCPKTGLKVENLKKKVRYLNPVEAVGYVQPVK